MRIVVTGGAGLIGKWVVRDLASDHEVLIFDRMRPTDPPPGVRFKLGDHEDLGSVYDVLRGYDAVVHLAAITTSEFHPAPVVFRTNTLGSYYVGEAAGRLGLKKIVFASSMNVLGISMAERKMAPLHLPIDEDHPRRPQDPYGLSKALGEDTMAALTRRTGIRTISLRPAIVVEPERYPELVGGLGDPSRHFRPLWTYGDIRDVATGFRLALENETLENEVFFITADDALALEPLADLVPRFYPGTQEIASTLTGTRPAVDNSKAKRLLGYRPQFSWRDMT